LGSGNSPAAARVELRDHRCSDIEADIGCARAGRDAESRAFLLDNTGQPLSSSADHVHWPSPRGTDYVSPSLWRTAYLLFAIPKIQPFVQKNGGDTPQVLGMENGLRRANWPQRPTRSSGPRLERVLLPLASPTEESDTLAAESSVECGFVTDTAAIQECADSIIASGAPKSGVQITGCAPDDVVALILTIKSGTPCRGRQRFLKSRMHGNGWPIAQPPDFRLGTVGR